MEEIAYLALTLLIEVPIAFIVMPKHWRLRTVWVVFCLNLITHPLAWILITHRFDWLVVEAGVFLVEAAFLTFFFLADKRRAILCAMVMNAVSALIGILI